MVDIRLRRGDKNHFCDSFDCLQSLKLDVFVTKYLFWRDYCENNVWKDFKTGFFLVPKSGEQKLKVRKGLEQDPKRFKYCIRKDAPLKTKVIKRAHCFYSDVQQREHM